MKGRAWPTRNGWAYGCSLFTGYGRSPSEAFLDYLSRFNYDGATLSIKISDAVIESADRSTEERHANYG